MSKKERYGIIYKIENTTNGKCYIGQTVRNFNERYYYSGKGIERVYRYHKNNKEHNRHYNIYLLRSIEKYGFESFNVIEELDVAYSEEELNKLEKKYIKEFDCINNGYNNKEGGSDGKYSEEVCKKISKKAKERCKDPEYRRKMSESRKGKYCGENHPNYGNHKLAGENHPMYGKQHTEETKRKMSRKAKERWEDPEERRKMSESRKGKCCGENHPMYGVHRYGKNNPMARKVICLNDNNIFDTGKECAEYYKLSKGTITNICKGITKKTRTGLKFMYYDEYIQQQEQTA